MANASDLYSVLGVARDASADDIRKAYRGLARKYHPDVNGGSAEATERFKEINQAYEVLSNPEKRARYDRLGTTGAEGDMGGGEGGFGFGGGFANFNDIFDMVFGDAGRAGGQPEQPGRGGDLRCDLEITLEECLSGVEKTIPITRMETCGECTGSGSRPGSKPQSCVKCAGSGYVRASRQTLFGVMSQVSECSRCQGRGEIITDPCPRCHGRGREKQSRKITVDVPPGAGDRTRIRLSGQGEGGVNGGPAGDLYVFLHLKSHPVFRREGLDLVNEVEISFARAALGGPCDIPTLEGTEPYPIPAGTQPGDVFRLRGKGLPELNRPQVRGDQHVVVKVRTPTRLNERQKKALLEFAEASGENLEHAEPDAGQSGGGFFERFKNLFHGRDDDESRS